MGQKWWNHAILYELISNVAYFLKLIINFCLLKIKLCIKRQIEKLTVNNQNVPFLAVNHQTDPPMRPSFTGFYSEWKQNFFTGEFLLFFSLIITTIQRSGLKL